MNLPKVTINIPTYNQKQYIQKTIQSALMQDYPNLEIIVSDDSTDDETQNIAEQFKHDSRFRYYRNKPSLGRVKNYRRLLYELAAGEWVVNLDGDDFYSDPGFISEAINSIYKTGEKEVLFYMASKTMQYPDRERALQPNIAQDQMVMTAGDYFYNIYSIKYFGHLTTVYNAALARTSGFYEKDIISSDMFSFFKWCLKDRSKKVILSKKIVGSWVQHGSNESSQYTFKKYFRNGKMYFSLLAESFKNNPSGFLKNLRFFGTSLFLYWGSYFKRQTQKK